MKRIFGNTRVVHPMETPLGEIIDAPEYSLESFRKGTRQSQCSYIREWPWAFNGGLLVSRLFEYSAQRHLVAGRLDEALLEIQTLAQLGLDLGNSPETVAVGHGMLHSAIHELVELIRDARTTEELLDRIQTTVRFMDRYFPAALTVMRRMGVLIGEQILHKGGPNFRLRRTLPFVEGDRAFEWFDDQWESVLVLEAETETHAWKTFEPVYREQFMKHVEAGGPWFWPPSQSIEDPGARHDCLAHIRLVLAGLLARHGERPGNPAWPENPYSLTPVEYRAGYGEVACDGLTWTGGCWADGYSMVLKLGR